MVKDIRLNNITINTKMPLWYQSNVKQLSMLGYLLAYITNLDICLWPTNGPCPPQSSGSLGLPPNLRKLEYYPSKLSQHILAHKI